MVGGCGGWAISGGYCFFLESDPPESNALEVRLQPVGEQVFLCHSRTPAEDAFSMWLHVKLLRDQFQMLFDKSCLASAEPGYSA